MQAASAAPRTLSLHSARPVLPGIVHPGHGVSSARAQVRAPVQLTFARSVEPVLPLEIAITRMAATTEADAESKGDIRTMGRKYIVPYGLYRAHGCVSAPFAADERKGTGLSEADLELLWAALEQMFDHDRSAARGEMTARGLSCSGKRRFLEGLIAIYELGVKFERHGRDPRRMTPAMLLEHFGVSYAEGHGRARDRFDELVGLLRSPRPGKGY